MAKDCKSKALNWMEDDEGLTTGALGSGVSTASTMPIQELASVFLNSFQDNDDEDEDDASSGRGSDLLQLGISETALRQYRDWRRESRQYEDWKDSRG